jgi:hypothetical protein
MAEITRRALVLIKEMLAADGKIPAYNVRYTSATPLWCLRCSCPLPAQAVVPAHNIHHNRPPMLYRRRWCGRPCCR